MRSYNSTTNLSIDVVWLVIPSNLGCKNVLENEFVSLPKWLHVFYATFFPLHAKNETWSHQLNAWNSGRYFDLLGPRATVILCISRHLICFPVSIGNQSLANPVVQTNQLILQQHLYQVCELASISYLIGWHPLHVTTSLFQLLPDLKSGRTLLLAPVTLLVWARKFK